MRNEKNRLTNHSCEYRFKHKQGHYIWIQATERVFKQDLDQIIGTAQDITDTIL